MNLSWVINYLIRVLVASFLLFLLSKLEHDILANFQCSSIWRLQVDWLSYEYDRLRFRASSNNNNILNKIFGGEISFLLDRLVLKAYVGRELVLSKSIIWLYIFECSTWIYFWEGLSETWTQCYLHDSFGFSRQPLTILIHIIVCTWNGVGKCPTEIKSPNWMTLF